MQQYTLVLVRGCLPCGWECRAESLHLMSTALSSRRACTKRLVGSWERRSVRSSTPRSQYSSDCLSSGFSAPAISSSPAATQCTVMSCNLDVRKNPEQV